MNKHPVNNRKKYKQQPQTIKHITINNHYGNSVAPSRRIIIRNSGGGDDDFLQNIMQQLMGNKEQVPVLKEAPKPESVESIDRTNMKFISENPTTVEDLIELSNQIGTKYNENEVYNVDLKKLGKMKPYLIELNNMVGLKDVKTKIVDIILYHLQRLNIKNIDMLHTIIDGSPGTGKTEIAHIYCNILASMGVLSKGTFRKAKRSDLVGGFLGHTAILTSKMLEECKGGVLFIDEFYSLGHTEGKSGSDSFSKECIDTIMQFMSENKDDFVLVVAGYKEDIIKCVLSMNDGIERRFPVILSIGKYSPEELHKIFLKKVKDCKWDIEENAVPDDLFKENKEYFKFFGGDIEILVTKCKYAHSRNLLKNHEKKNSVLDKKDIEDGLKMFISTPEIAARKNDIKNDMYV